MLCFIQIVQFNIEIYSIGYCFDSINGVSIPVSLFNLSVQFISIARLYNLCTYIWSNSTFGIVFYSFCCSIPNFYVHTVVMIVTYSIQLRFLFLFFLVVNYRDWFSLNLNVMLLF